MNLKNLKIPPIHKMFFRFLGRFHVVTFVVIVAVGMSVATFFIYQTVISSTEIKQKADIYQTMPDFEKDTIDRINNLTQSKSELEDLKFPDNQRTNPFSE